MATVITHPSLYCLRLARNKENGRFWCRTLRSWGKTAVFCAGELGGENGRLAVFVAFHERVGGKRPFLGVARREVGGKKRLFVRVRPCLSASYRESGGKTAVFVQGSWGEKTAVFHHSARRPPSVVRRLFAYAASGQRVKTVEPAGKTTYFPFPNYEETVVGSSTIKRSSYALAGQVVAFRVAGDPVTANNGLFFIYGDHLGSTSVLQKSGDTQPVAGSWARYKPYGSYRTTPTQTLTDRDFTGQRENRELGLLYYQARYYLPGVGRFISADTIVPSPANPQSLNRYTYVNNNSLKFIDPSGHRTCSSQQATSGDETCNQNTGSSSGSLPKTQPQNGCNEVWCKNSGPSNLPRNNWYPNADVEQALANTQQVLDWLSNYTGSNWWGGGPNSLPSETQLAAWLLMEEGSTLQWDDHLLFMARIIRYRLRNGGLTVENLSGFTAFFNPDGGSEFSANDWSLLVLNGPGERYTSAIKEAYSMKNYEPLDVNGKLVLWWWKESEAKGVSNGYLVNGVQPKTIVAHNPLILENFYFGNYEQCVAANFGGC
ncbi:MAG: hypothetical protein H6668_04305 [Ardenticatenaceae bacterium]|nr:hypothetical protein [Ardenticatenaceae bacterium]